MNNRVANVISFAVGAAIASATTFFIVKSKYEKEKDDFYENEVKPARDEYLTKAKELDETNKNLIEENKVQKERMSQQYDELIQERGYKTDDGVVELPPHEPDPEPEPKPDYVQYERPQSVLQRPSPQNVYRITSDQFGSIDGYAERSLLYQPNGVAIDNEYNIVDDLDYLIGDDIYNSIPELIENAEDVIWVRNDETNTDYEIQFVDDNFTN